MFRSDKQKYVCLSLIEAELSAGITYEQNMLCGIWVIQSLELKVILPMLLEIDIKGTVYLATNGSVVGWTRYIDIK